MSDYTLQVTWSTKDTLIGGESLKAISATELGNEFSAISTAVNSKYDSDDIASQPEAEAGVSNSKIMTPLRVQNWADFNAGMVGNIQALADPNADTLLGWDDSASAVINFGLGDGLESSGTNIQLDLKAAGGLKIVSGEAALDIAGLASIAPVSADSIAFYDVSTGLESRALISTLQGILSITESQISDLGSYIESGDTVASLTITSGTIPTLVSTTATITNINVGNADTTIGRAAAGKIEVENKPAFLHTSTSYESAEVTYSTSAPTGGTNGDVWYQYTA